MEDMENNNVDYSSEETPLRKNIQRILIVAGILGGITVACFIAISPFSSTRQRTIARRKLSP
jgi:hypothetical protein